MGVEMEIGSTVHAGGPVPLSDTPDGTGRNNYAVSRNGQRFLSLVPTVDATSAPATMILNGTSGSKQTQ